MASSAFSLPTLRGLAGCLMLALPWAPTAFAVSSADYFVEKLPGQPSEPPVKMHAGHVEVDSDHNGNLFFWHFQNQHIASRQRTVIWLNGGPGCSSEDGALMEIGPYRVHGEELVYNNGSWNEFANLLFVDNPVGTGYSYVDTNAYLHELDEMADQFVDFMEKWFDLFPQYKNDDIYFAGESYAGQHIPYIAKHVLDRNKDSREPWNLKGLIIGNGWISPKEQYESYLKFAYEKELIQRGSDESKKLEQQWHVCRTQLAVDVTVDVGECEKILQDFLELTAMRQLSGGRQCYNMYDVRLKDVYPKCGMSWPPDLPDVENYLRKREVTDALHINSGKSTGWKECNGAVGSAFRAQNSEPSRELLPEILEQVPITLFSGAEDLICNHIGTENFIAGMEWNGGKGWELGGGGRRDDKDGDDNGVENGAPRLEWHFEGEDVGYWQEARNLTYVLFNEASHMVPFDWPRRSLDMLNRVMGVDPTLAGQLPADSHIDGEPGNSTSSGQQEGYDDADEATQDQVDKAKWDAYYRSGSVVLVIVIIAAAAWGWYIWRERRKRSGYHGLASGESGTGPGGVGARGIDRFQDRRAGRDVETGDFDESELDDLHVTTPTEGMDKEPYAVGGDSDEDDVGGPKKDKHANRINGSSSQ